MKCIYVKDRDRLLSNVFVTMGSSLIILISCLDSQIYSNGLLSLVPSYLFINQGPDPILFMFNWDLKVHQGPPFIHYFKISSPLFFTFFLLCTVLLQVL